MSFESVKSQFVKQEMVKSEEMVKARVQLHYAIFSLQALSAAYAPFQEDWSHISFDWEGKRGEFLSQQIPGKNASARFGIAIESPLLLQVDSNGAQVLRSLSLQGVSLEGLREWMREGVSSLGLDSQTLDFTLSKELPPHEIAERGTFHFEGLERALLELKRVYGNAHLFLEAIHRDNPEASPVRCWPHHFDMATLFQFEVPGDREPKKTMGMGISPGDRFYPAPYYYVTPWPFSTDLTLPPLPAGGIWHLDEWQGAVLRHEALVRLETGEAQFQALSDFLLATREVGLHILRAGQKR